MQQIVNNRRIGHKQVAPEILWYLLVSDALESSSSSSSEEYSSSSESSESSSSSSEEYSSSSSSEEIILGIGSMAVNTTFTIA